MDAKLFEAQKEGELVEAKENEKNVALQEKECVPPKLRRGTRKKSATCEWQRQKLYKREAQRQ